MIFLVTEYLKNTKKLRKKWKKTKYEFNENDMTTISV